jgi:hypothetical protein
MAFNLSNLNPASRFYLSKDETEWVELKILSDRELKEVRKKVSKKKAEYKSSGRTGLQRIEYVDVDEEMLADEINDLCISNWNLLDTDGNEIPCTRDNKLLLVGSSPEFSTFISDSLETLKKDKEEKEKEEEKNF